MTPTPPTTAPRLWADYTGNGRSHTMLFHFNAGTTSGAAVTAITPVLNAMAGAWWTGVAWSALRWAPAGSTVSTNLTLPTLTAGTGGTPGTTWSPSGFVQWGARNSNGKRAKFYLFETQFTGNAGMRSPAGNNAVIDAITAAFVAAMETSPGPLACIDSISGVFYTYANLGQNDYWTHAVR